MRTTKIASGLYFSFTEMEQEAVNMALIASKYLDDEHDDSHAIITTWRKQLSAFRTSQPGTKFDWAIPFQRPIRTKLSVGKYEPDGNGEHSVYATLSSIWQIAIPALDMRTAKRGTPQSHFEVFGKASTRVSVFAHRGQGAADELARWRFEIGNQDSPGCHFHAQILGEAEDRIFPKSMSVPRLPNMLFTPMDALEFVLAELFQDEWAEHVAKETDAIRNWAGCQKRRLIRLLQWQQDRLEKYSGSPWTSLKAAKPDANLLVEAR
jgi:hypothetical protein